MGSTHCGYVVQVTNIRPHTNADRLQIATFFGEDVCVDLTVKENDIGIYFPCDLQLDLDFCIHNNLLSKLPDGTRGPGYMDIEKRNVKAIRLRGEKSNGLYLPITCLEYLGVNLSDYPRGTVITTVGGVEICKKYIPRGKKTNSNIQRGQTKRVKENIAPTFYEHADTEQLAYNLNAFKVGDDIEITLKMHGTSQRTGYLPVLNKERVVVYNPFKGIFLRCLPNSKLRNYLIKKWGEPAYDYDVISGTRRTILDTFDGGFYGSDKFREKHHNFFKGKLYKNETVYYELVGYTDTGAPIMSTGSTPREDVKTYGPVMEFSYGCCPIACAVEGMNDSSLGYHSFTTEQNHIYVYRMTMTNPDGNVVEYSPDYMRYRCEQMGVDTVPVFWHGRIPEYEQLNDGSINKVNPGEWVKNLAEQYYDGPDPIGKTHVREGVVVRILNRPTFTAYKTKNICFKIVEGLIKEAEEVPDMEEAEDLNEQVE